MSPRRRDSQSPGTAALRGGERIGVARDSRRGLTAKAGSTDLPHGSPCWPLALDLEGPLGPSESPLTTEHAEIFLSSVRRRLLRRGLVWSRRPPRGLSSAVENREPEPVPFCPGCNDFPIRDDLTRKQRSCRRGPEGRHQATRSHACDTAPEVPQPLELTVAQPAHAAKYTLCRDTALMGLGCRQRINQQGMVRPRKKRF